MILSSSEVEGFVSTLLKLVH